MELLRFLAAALVCLALFGCAAEEQPEQPRALPERIIAVAPSVVEIVFELGLGDRVVGVGDYAQWPPEVFSKPRIGGLFDARLEKIVELDPDLAILLPGEERLAAQMNELGVEILTVEHESLADVEAALLKIAERMEMEVEGRERADAFLTALAPEPLGSSPVVLLTITRGAGNLGEILVAGPNTFYDELLERLGVVNAFGSAELSYPQVSAESVLRRAPHVVIELQPKRLSSAGEDRLLSDWKQLTGLPAVEQKCLRVVSGDHVLLPGPRATQLYRELRQAILSCPSYS